MIYFVVFCSYTYASTIYCRCLWGSSRNCLIYDFFLTINFVGHVEPVAVDDGGSKWLGNRLLWEYDILISLSIFQIHVFSAFHLCRLILFVFHLNGDIFKIAFTDSSCLSHGIHAFINICLSPIVVLFLLDLNNVFFYSLCFILYHDVFSAILQNCCAWLQVSMVPKFWCHLDVE